MSNSGIDIKQDELRTKGAAFFEQFLEQARQGKDALSEDPRNRRKVDVEAAEDEDLETVGRILPHIIGALYFASTTAKLVVAKVICHTYLHLHHVISKGVDPPEWS